MHAHESSTESEKPNHKQREKKEKRKEEKEEKEEKAASGMTTPGASAHTTSAPSGPPPPPRQGQRSRRSLIPGFRTCYVLIFCGLFFVLFQAEPFKSNCPLLKGSGTTRPVAWPCVCDQNHFFDVTFFSFGCVLVYFVSTQTCYQRF